MFKGMFVTKNLVKSHTEEFIMYLKYLLCIQNVFICSHCQSQPPSQFPNLVKAQKIHTECAVATTMKANIAICPVYLHYGHAPIPSKRRCATDYSHHCFVTDCLRETRRTKNVLKKTRNFWKDPIMILNEYIILSQLKLCPPIIFISVPLISFVQIGKKNFLFKPVH